MVEKAVSGTQTKRYMDVANSLMAEIVNGRYVVGTLLPTEHELATQYVVSRQTVRAALSLLKDKGYISRKKAVGSRVESVSPAAMYSQSVNTIEDLIQVAVTEVRSVESVADVKLDKALARQLEAPVASQWLRLTGPRIDARSKQPSCWANIYINTAYEEALDNIRRQPQLMISDILESVCGVRISEVRQTVFGVLIDRETALRLNVEENSAGLRILRHYRDEQGQIVELTETLYPASRISVSTHLKRVSIGAG